MRGASGWPEVIGYVGAATLVLAYLISSISDGFKRSLAYHCSNLAGAGGIIVSAWVVGNWPSVALNSFWMLVAAFFILDRLR